MTRNNLLAALAVLVLLIAALAGYWILSGDPETADDAATTAPQGTAAGGADADTERDAASAGTTSDPQSDTQTAARSATEDSDDAATRTEPAVDPAAPSFDIVRIEPDGSAVIAGRAAPGAEVRIYDGDTLLGTVTADARGEWVYVPEAPLPPGDRELSLEATNPDGTVVAGNDVVVLSVPERQVAAADGGATAATAGASDGAAGGTAGGTAPVAVLTPKSGGPSRVLQGPVEIAPIAEAKGLNLWAVDYVESTNRLTMSGVAAPQSRIFLYLDNEFLGEASAGKSGDWRLSVTREIAEGEYPMRVDLVDAEGKVQARLEVPFIYLPQGFLAVGNRVTVRPGNSLWRIARRVYGEGVQYTTIYDANKAQIIDPDIIYPGQVFYVPNDG